MAVQGGSEGGWPSGWLIAAVAGVLGAILAIWIGATGMAASLLVGVFVFLVFGVILGMFWGVPASDGHDGHDHGGHGHDAHGHGGHGHDDHGHGGHGHHGDPHERLHGPSPDHIPPLVAAAGPIAVLPPEGETPVVPELEPDSVLSPAMPSPAAAEPAAAPVAGGAGAKPVALAGPRGGKGDDLQVLEGIGPAMEKLCHELGIWHYDQIAGWSPAEVAWMDGNLKGFRGRVSRDRWVAQARIITTAGIEEFRRRAKADDY